MAELFRFSVPPLELIVRGTLVYWFLFALFRFFLRRDVGSIAIADVLLLVLIADASQNAMAGSYETVVDGFVLVGTIAAWNFGLDWTSFHFAAVRRIVVPPPLPLIEDGRLNRRAMRRELVSEEELRSTLRQNGLEHFSQVKRAVMESDGEITIVKRDKGDDAGKPAKRPAGVT